MDLDNNTSRPVGLALPAVPAACRPLVPVERQQEADNSWVSLRVRQFHNANPNDNDDDET